MPNEFFSAMQDIFHDPNFRDYCLINGEIFNCICQSTENGVIYSEAGLVNDVNFTLSIQLPISRMPKNGDICIFKDVKYKVDHVDVDSAHTSITVYLQSQSKGS